MQMHNAAEPPDGLEQQAESLGRLSWMFLRLLLARRTIGQVMGGAQNDAELQRRSPRWSGSSTQPGLSEELARSLSGQLEILRQRLQQRTDGDRKLAYIEAELERIQQQVELIREQAAMSTDPELLSRRIDDITATLGSDRPVDSRSAAGLRRDGGPADRAAAAGARRARAGEPVSARAAALGGRDARPVPLRIGRPVPPARQRLRRGPRRAASCCRCRPSSSRSCSRPTTSCCATTAAAACGRRAAPTTGATGSRAALGKESSSLTLTREPGAALELIDRYLLRDAEPAGAAQSAGGAPRRIAVIIEFAEFVVPRGDAAHLGGPFAANTVKVLGWANDPAIVQSNIVTVLLSEGLHDLSELVVENPHAAALHLPLPDEDEMSGVRADARRRAVPRSRIALGRAARRPSRRG